MVSNGFGTTYDQAEETSLVGPASPAESHAHVGLAEPTPEEVERALKGTEKATDHAESDIIHDGAGKKILLDKANANLGKDPDTGAPLVKNSAGIWLTPADGDYEKTLYAVAPEQADQAAQMKAQQSEQAAPQPEQPKQEQKEVVDAINTMIAIDEGSTHPHPLLDEHVLQKIRSGASAMALNNLKPIVAAVDGFANHEATDVNPSRIGHLKPTEVSGPGVDLAMDAVRKRKEKENAQFEEQMRRREREKKS